MAHGHSRYHVLCDVLPVHADDDVRARVLDARVCGQSLADLGLVRLLLPTIGTAALLYQCFPQSRLVFGTQL